MAAKRKPRCFVAMAFDHADTDALYEGQIEPALRANSIIPIIINRRQSNDDLNVQIIREIESCDFCIADLTYARQSVYFEAGYAQRKVPVIYTTRRDHLKRDAPDDRRVHFDLQMKPIIPWSNAHDPAFGIRLERRLRATVLRDWSRMQRMSDAADRAEWQFASLPLTERLALLRRKAVAMLRTLGFRDWIGQAYGVKHKTRDILAGRINFVRAQRVRDKTVDLASVQSFATLPKADLVEMKFSGSSWGHTAKLPRDGPPIENIRAYNLVLCLQSIPVARIESVFSRLGRGTGAGNYTGQEVIRPIDYRGTDQVVTFSQDWNFMGALRSEKELADRLKEARTRIT